MIYHFKHIENGQITEGYVVIDINDRQAEIDNGDGPAILLAEKNGGELVAQQGKTPMSARLNQSSLAGVVEVIEVKDVKKLPETSQREE